jgi:putative endonuclease
MRDADPGGDAAPARPGHQMQLDLGVPPDLGPAPGEGGGRGRTPYKQRLGAVGEERAAAWYLARGYEVVARNWRCRDGELDLVVAGHGHVVFCEVKTRTSDRFGLPAEAVTARKQQRLRLLAARFLREEPQAVAATATATALRFDVASVRNGRVSVIEGAF